jgi:hypothetical protein
LRGQPMLREDGPACCELKPEETLGFFISSSLPNR